MSDILWFQLLKWDDLLLFFVIYYYNLNIFVDCVIFRIHLKMSLWALGSCDRDFFHTQLIIKIMLILTGKEDNCCSHIEPNTVSFDRQLSIWCCSSKNVNVTPSPVWGFSVLYHFKLNNLGFVILIKQNETSKDIDLGSRELQWAFSNIVWHFLTKQ